MATLFATRLAQHARADRGGPAVAMPGAAIDYADLLQRAQRCAGRLVREGCTTAQPVGVAMADDLSHLTVSLALLVLGIPQVCLPAADPPPMRRQMAQRLGLARVIVDAPEQALVEWATTVYSPAWLEGGAAAARVKPVAADDDAPALFVTSSGTTGTPKIVALSQRALATRAAQIARGLGFAPDERVMLPLPVTEHQGKSVRLNALLQGGTAILATGPAGTPSLLDLCTSLRVTFLQLTVLQARNLLTADAAPRLAPATRVFVGAARMPKGFPRAFAAGVGGRLFDRYGTTEASLIATTFPGGDDGVPDSVGRVVPGAELEIVDAAGKPLPPGEPGTIRMRSDGMVHAYHDDPAATARHFRDGWFLPGDVGALTPDGSVRFLGRNDDMMILNGINIFPAEIERVLEDHPAVKASAAFPIPSPVFGDIPAAAVELNDAAQATAADLLAYAREHLGVRAPRRIAILDRLPRNAAGKIVKREIPALLKTGRG